MVAKLCDRAARTALNISLEAAARLVGVSKNTLRLYELDPIGVVGAVTRAACAALYDDLRGLLERAEARRDERRRRRG